MRCDEVVRELAVPTVDRDRAELAEHLAGCPACAERARRSEALDRLWGATGPAEPSPEAWDAVWANIARSLPCPAPLPARAEESYANGVVPSRNGHGPRILVHPAPAPTLTPPPSDAVPRTRGRGWRFASIALIGLAQAAAILIALGLAWRPVPRPDAPRFFADNSQPAAPEVIRSAARVDFQAEVDASSLMVIHFDQKTGRAENCLSLELNSSADIGMEVTNAMESIATPQVAVR